jgi:uncharacterized HhH-GPD family protein
MSVATAAPTIRRRSVFVFILSPLGRAAVVIPAYVTLERARPGAIHPSPYIVGQVTDGTLHITGDAEADRLLNTNGTALLIGMLLDQQVPMEWAFGAPKVLAERLGGLHAARIAAMDEEEFVAVCCTKPAIHRFPAAMGRRIHALCRLLVEDYDGDGAAIWDGVGSGAELRARLRALPGFGEEKTKIFIALLAKRFGVHPEGWEKAAGPFADATPRSAADVDGPTSLAEVREWKRAQKAAGRSKQD